jgi:hexosaminidase
MGSDPSACSDGTPHGGYYTAAELRTLVEYAACRGVTIVPEIEMPGHVRAALAAYPELGNHPDRTLPVWDRWGVCPDILNVEEATLQFCREVLSHVADVFPSRYIHLGGDECPTGQWEDSVAARRRAAGLGLDRPAALHGWFLEQMVTHLDGLGRRAVAWDETGHASGRLPRRLALTAWRDAAHAAEAIGHGHQVVMAPHRFTYFDYPQSDHPHEPAGQPGQTVTLADVYGFDPLAGRLTAVPTLADDSPGVLGTQANLWTEYAPTPDQVSYLAYPRLCALAEVAWSTPPLDLYAFQGRLNAHQRRLGAAGAIRRPAARSGRRMVVGGD